VTRRDEATTCKRRPDRGAPRWRVVASRCESTAFRSSDDALSSLSFAGFVQNRTNVASFDVFAVAEQRAQALVATHR
jgi:hypothetical protein